MDKKVCNVCNLELSIANFKFMHVKKENRSYYLNFCNLCRLEKVKVSNQKRKEIKKEWARANGKKRYAREKANGRAKAMSQESYVRNKAAYVARAQSRYLNRKEQTPSCVSFKDLQQFYDKAKELTQLTGTCHNVDHIIPLKHPEVCGLNAPWNLQVLTEHENKVKSNKFDFTIDNLGWKDGFK